MIDDLPWGDYSKARIPSGWAYPLGRDAIADALRDAGATLGSLGLWGPGRPPVPGAATVLLVTWMGDALPGYHGPIAGGQARLHMSLYAVPSDQRSQIADQLMAAPLLTACRWAADALTKGNVWSASEHEYRVRCIDGELQATIT